jgi:predicted nucleic-acid-binding Zn-ribbon protein
MANELGPFQRTRCPKCRNEDITKLFYAYHTECPENDKICAGQKDEHLHFECRACNYTGPMRTADTDTGVTPAVTTTVQPVVAGAKRHKVRRARPE